MNYSPYRKIKYQRNFHFPYKITIMSIYVIAILPSKHLCYYLWNEEDIKNR